MPYHHLGCTINSLIFYADLTCSWLKLTVVSIFQLNSSFFRITARGVTHIVQCQRWWTKVFWWVGVSTAKWQTTLNCVLCLHFSCHTSFWLITSLWMNKCDEATIKCILHRYIYPLGCNKYIKCIIYLKKLKSSNLIIICFLFGLV